MRMLQSIVKLTRSSHLWPVRAFTGKASLPVLDKLGTIHADVGITRGHFDLMKSVLAQCCRDIDPVAFTPGVEKALGFIDVVGNSLTKFTEVCEEELARQTSSRFAATNSRLKISTASSTAHRPPGCYRPETVHEDKKRSPFRRPGFRKTVRRAVASPQSWRRFPLLPRSSSPPGTGPVIAQIFYAIARIAGLFRALRRYSLAQV